MRWFEGGGGWWDRERRWEGDIHARGKRDNEFIANHRYMITSNAYHQDDSRNLHRSLLQR